MMIWKKKFRNKNEKMHSNFEFKTHLKRKLKEIRTNWIEEMPYRTEEGVDQLNFDLLLYFIIRSKKNKLSLIFFTVSSIVSTNNHERLLQHFRNHNKSQSIVQLLLFCFESISKYPKGHPWDHLFCNMNNLIELRLTPQHIIVEQTFPKCLLQKHYKKKKKNKKKISNTKTRKFLFTHIPKKQLTIVFLLCML